MSTVVSRLGPIYDSAARVDPVRTAIQDLYSYRALVRLLVARDLVVRYKRSVLGVTWTVLNPLFTSVIMWAVFSHLFHARISGGIPYIVYLLAGVLTITYFQQGVSMTAASLISSAGLLTKVYVPPVVFAFSAAFSGAVNFLFGLVPLLLFQVSLGVGVPWTIILLPLPLALLLAMIAGIGLFLSTFAIRFDDILNLVNNAVLVIFAYVTPVFYPVNIVPEQYRKYFYLNPMYSYVNVIRYLDYGGPAPRWPSYVVVVGTGVVGLAVGLWVFVRRWPRVAVLL